MKTLTLACTGVITNVGVLNILAVLPCTVDDGDILPPDTAFVSVTVVPLFLEHDPAILLIDRID